MKPQAGDHETEGGREAIAPIHHTETDENLGLGGSPGRDGA